MHFSEVCLAHGWTFTEPSNPVLWYAGGLWLGCAGLRVTGWLKEAGQVISLSNDIDSTVTSRFKLAVVVRSSQTVERHAPPLYAMEEILYGLLRYMISLVLTTDDALMLRTAGRRWTVGNRSGGCLLLDGETGTDREKCALDADGNCVSSMSRKRHQIMDSIRRRGLHPPPEETPPGEQGRVDMTSFMDTFVGLIGKAGRRSASVPG